MRFQFTLNTEEPLQTDTSEGRLAKPPRRVRSLYPTFLSSIGFLLLQFVPLAAHAEEAKPDLDVTTIERAPLYPAYAVAYDIPGFADLPILIDAQTRQTLPSAQAQSIQRQPAPGEKVTFTAHILNKGSAPLPAWKFHWLLDDKPYQEGTHREVLAPGQEAVETCAWNWQVGPHRLRFVADPQHEIAQTFQTNDSREVATDAWLFLLGIDRATYADFNRLPNHIGTRSFEDWALWHVEKMNQLLQSSPSPLNPHGGSRVRIACNKIVVRDNPTDSWTDVLPGVFTPADAGYDGAWQFGRAQDLAKWAAAPDWGLIHEWGHQLGLADENLLDRDGAQNLVTDASGDPLLLGRVSPLSGYLMHTVAPVGFSPESMAALEAQYGKRRGYYGDHYFTVPLTNVVSVLDAEGKPVPEARLSFWQDEAGRYQGEPAFAGMTDIQGAFVLPNRSAPPLTTETGFTLHDNPFGQISVTGAKDVFFIRIVARGQTETAWLDVTDLNLAYWSGSKNTATVTLKTHIPSTDALPAPGSLLAEKTGEGVTLTWEAVGGAKSYRVYRANGEGGIWEPDGMPITDTTARSKPMENALTRYAVVTLAANGRESAFSNTFGVLPLRDPWGLAVTRNGRRLIRDRDTTRTILQKPNGSFVGQVGASEPSFEASSDLVIDSRGRIISTKERNSANPHSGFIIQNPDMSVEASVLQAPGSSPGHFQKPTGVAVDSHDNIFLCDTGNDRIQEFGPDGKFKAVIGEGLVKQPLKLAIDHQDNLIICDTASDRLTVLRKDADGVYRLHGHANNLPHPVYIAIDPEGRFFISCQGDHSIVALNSQFYRMAWRYAGPEGSPLKEPRGIAFSKGHLLIVDGGNGRIVETPLPK